jgi:AcrR family transcriptional regulator
MRAALRLFSELPYEDVSVDQIAAEAGVAKGLLYYYFGSKRGLYATGLGRLAADMREQMLAAIADGELSSMGSLASAFDAHLSYIEKRSAGYRALLGSAGAHPEVRAILERERTFHREFIEERLPPEVPRGAALTVALRGWLHFVDGAVLAWLEGGDLERQQVRELCTRVLTSSVIAAVKVDRAQVLTP